jgi:hypothetical protein
VILCCVPLQCCYAARNLHVSGEQIVACTLHAVRSNGAAHYQAADIAASWPICPPCVCPSCVCPPCVCGLVLAAGAVVAIQ